MPARPDSLLWWRAGMVSSLTCLVGAAAHVSGGGLLPSGPVSAAVLVIGLAIATTLSALVLGGAASTPRIVALVVTGQTVCHAVLSLGAGHRGDAAATSTPASAPTGHAGLPVQEGARVGSLHDHYEATVGATASGATLTVPDPGVLVDHLPMFLAHTAVAILVGLWLAAGERAVASVLTMVFAAVVALFVVLALPPLGDRCGAPVRRRPATLPSLARVSRCVVRRGPPALLAA